MRCFLSLLLAVASVSFADRGALSVDASASFAARSVPAPMAETPQSVVSLAPIFFVGGRYALSNSLEVSATGFGEVPVTVWHNPTTLVTDSGSFPGALRSTAFRFGGQAGARLVLGMVFKFVAGLEVGLSHQVLSSLKLVDLTTTAAEDGAFLAYDLPLKDVPQTQFVVSPLLGVEWAAGDAWSLSLLLRAQLLLGGPPTWAVTLPLQFSWSWYL
jgi:hypothetical protein